MRASRTPSRFQARLRLPRTADISMNVFSTFGLAVLVCGAMSAAANAQIIPNTYGQGAPIIGGTYNMPPPPTAPVFGTGPDLIPRQHKNPTGQPCVTISGFASPQLVN